MSFLRDPFCSRTQIALSCLNNDLILKVCLHFSVEMAQYQIHSLHTLLSPKAREIPALLSDSK